MESVKWNRKKDMEAKTNEKKNSEITKEMKKWKQKEKEGRKYFFNCVIVRGIIWRKGKRMREKKE